MTLTSPTPATLDSGSAPDTGRVDCLRCHRPVSLCLCAFIPRVEARTGITVLQHPRERRHPIGTARFVELGLGARVLCPVHTDRTLACRPELPEGTALLYPGEGSRDLAELSPEERPQHLVILDGTWNHAKRLWRANPWLETLPQVRINPAEPSRYRIRREPEGHCLSTLEAVVAALRAIEPELQGLDGLLGAFDRMIDLQIERARTAVRSPRKKKRTHQATNRLPRALHEDYEQLVLLYTEWGEPARPPFETQRTVLQWTALRPSTGETFERRIPAQNARSAAYAAKLGLDQGPLVDAATALAELHAFVGAQSAKRPPLAAWDRAPLLHYASGLDGLGALCLREVYRMLRGATGGSLEAVLEREQITPSPLPLGGLAGARLANASALVDGLRALFL